MSRKKTRRNIFKYYLFKLIRFLLSLAALPVAVLVTAGTLKRIDFSSFAWPMIWAFFAGAACAWLFMYYMPKAANLMYAAGHELTHAIGIILMGGKVKKIKIGSAKGSVIGTKEHTFIAILPYLFPFYTVAVLVLAGPAAYYIKNASAMAAFLYLTGFAWFVHAAYTMELLMSIQDDLEYAGYFFSIVFSYLVNLFIFMAIYATVHPSMEFLGEIKAIFISGTAFMLDAGYGIAAFFA